MTTDLLGVAIEWLAATGAPNWVVGVLLLTHPVFWSRTLRERVGPLLDAYLPGQKSDGES